MGATGKCSNIAAATDKKYCVATSSIVKNKSKWGLFCIFGIASLDDLKIAVDYGTDFVRVGIGVYKVDESLPFIELAKPHSQMSSR